MVFAFNFAFAEDWRVGARAPWLSRGLPFDDGKRSACMSNDAMDPVSRIPVISNTHTILLPAAQAVRKSVCASRTLGDRDDPSQGLAGYWASKPLPITGAALSASPCLPRPTLHAATAELLTRTAPFVLVALVLPAALARDAGSSCCVRARGRPASAGFTSSSETVKSAENEKDE